VHFDLGVPSSYAANSQSGPWGTVSISVKLRPSRACTNLRVLHKPSPGHSRLVVEFSTQ
jgi:hypothetical protein